MKASVRWGIIAAVGVVISFTAYYSQMDPAAGKSVLVYLGIGILVLAASVFCGILFSRKENPEAFDLKEGLKAGLTVTLIALLAYGLYLFLYLKYFNPEVIQKLIDYRSGLIRQSALSESQQEEQIANLTQMISPFKTVTLDILRLLFIGSISTFGTSFLMKAFRMMR